MADAAGEWQRDVVRALFGSYDPSAGLRHLREFFMLVPKKSSKTTAGAAIMITAMLMSRRPRAEFLMVAPTQEVADLAFRQAVGMVEADEVLRQKCHIQEHIKRITYRPTGAFLKVKSFDPKIVTGSKPAGVLIDELHVIAESHDADRVIGQLRGGLISQPEGFMVTITTQSERPPSGVFKAELQKARAVRDGKLSAPLLPLLYEFPQGVDWRDSANWHMVTPNNGRSITVERLIPDFLAAEASGVEELTRWASQHLNLEIGMNLRSDRWTGADYWEQQGTAGLELADLLRRSEVVTVGIDGGGLDDILGLAVMGRERGSSHWLLWAHGWIDEGAKKRRKSEAARYSDFERAGELSVVEGLPEDVQALTLVMQQVLDSGLLGGVGMDPSGVKEILAALRALGIPEDRLHGISQGWKLVSAIKTAERGLASGTLWHGGQALMAWCVGNAKVVPVGNAVRIDKQVSGSGKIDPLMAAFNAIEVMGTNPEPMTVRSFWEQAA